MSKSKKQNAEHDANLDEYYRETLNETIPYIVGLKDPQTVQICKKWIDRLHYAGNQRSLRNQYLGELYRRLKAGRVEGIFSSAPSKGLLPPIPYQPPSAIDPDSFSDSSASTLIFRPHKNTWMRCRQIPRTTSSPQQREEEEDETGETATQDERSEVLPKGQYSLVNKHSKSQVHVCKHRIDELTNIVRKLQMENEYLRQELLKSQACGNADDLHHLRAVLRQKNAEINDWKSRLVKAQQMQHDLEECYEEIIHGGRGPISDKLEKIKDKLLQEETRNEILRQKIDSLTQEVEKVSQEKEEELRLKQRNYEELLEIKEREFNAKYKNLETINRDLTRKNDQNEKNILLLNNRLQELENKLQLKTEEETKLQLLFSEQCSTMREEFSKMRLEMEAASEQQKAVLTEKISSLKKCILKLEKSKQKIILEYKQKIFEIENNKEIEMKALELQLQEQRNELSTALSTEKQCELDSLVNMLEERYKGFVATTEAMADSQRQKYLQDYLLKSQASIDSSDWEMPTTKRTSPNMLITGTPGVGKSTMAAKLAERTGLIWRDVSKIAIDNGCLEEYDEVYKCPVLDEDKLMDSMETYMSKGGNIVDYHGADFFPERWFDIVFVLRTSNTILYDRLTARGYLGKKLEDNIDCEIFQTILDEAKSSYKEEIVHELQSNTQQEIDENVNRVCQWLEQWKKDNQVV